MLIEAVLGLVLQIVRLLLLPIQIDDLPDAIKEKALEAFLLIVRGGQVVAAYTHFSYLVVLLTFVLAVNALIAGYRLIMWVLKKIPFLNIH